MQSHALRFGVDTGGTFTDLVIEGDAAGLRFYKRPTTPDDPVRGLLDALGAAADDFGTSVRELLGRGDMFVFGTTRATNAIVTGTAARTALITTQGHPDILLFREGGGRTTLFDYTQEYPEPYVPRSLTFQARERMSADGEVLVPLDEPRFVELARTLDRLDVEAVAVCLLWSIINPVHELRIAEILDRHLPNVPYTLSHRLNPCLREYRRASSAAIDASLKPLMSRFFANLKRSLAEEGFDGRLLIMTSAGGVLDAEAVAESPIHSIGSGPAAAPVAGRHFSQALGEREMAIVTDAGGTTYDVSLIRKGAIPWTRETKVGHPVYGYMTGFPSVDVRSIGAGGGSLAWVDDGGLLHVGPESAGADPGPAAYGRGGSRPTVTDACVVLGYIDPQYFLGGEIEMRVDLAKAAINRDVAEPLGLPVSEAAAAILSLAVERMARAIEEITLNQGIDPRAAIMIGGGGGAGLYAVGIARRLGTPQVVIPEVSAALSARGALLSPLRSASSVTEIMSSVDFDGERANSALAQVRTECEAFIAGPGAKAVSHSIVLSVEARYPNQVWEIEVPLPADRFTGAGDVEDLCREFHKVHREIFAVSDPSSPVELVTWRARVSCQLRSDSGMPPATVSERPSSVREAHFMDGGSVDATVRHLTSLAIGERLEGPVIVESPTTTVVIPPRASVERTGAGSLVISPWTDGTPGAPVADLTAEPASNQGETT